MTTYIWSPHAPRAGSYSDEGTGLFRESNEGVLKMRLTDIFLISSDE